MSNTQHPTNISPIVQAAAQTEPPTGRAEFFTLDGTVLTYQTSGGDKITFDMNMPLDDLMAFVDVDVDGDDPKAAMTALRTLLGDDMRKIRLLDVMPFFERLTFEAGRIMAVGLGE